MVRAEEVSCLFFSAMRRWRLATPAVSEPATNGGSSSLLPRLPELLCVPCLHSRLRNIRARLT